MDWELTNEDIDRLEYPWDEIEVYQVEKIVAQAQARKLVEWLFGDCLQHTEGILWRTDCKVCMQELRHQVGLE